MPDGYISREAALEDFESCNAENPNWTPQRVKTLLLRQPAADVAEVVYGKWENGNPICPVCGGNKFRDLDADIWCDWQPDFCPQLRRKDGWCRRWVNGFPLAVVRIL